MALSSSEDLEVGLLSNGRATHQEHLRRQRLMRIIFVHQLSTLSESLLTLQPRGQLLFQVLQGDTVAIARHINRGAFLVALSDLVLSPLVGSLSDRIGRRPFMLLTPAAVLPLKLLTALHPTASVLLLERVVCDALRTLGGTTMAYAYLADLWHGKEYTGALGQLNVATGLGIVVAPLLASMMMGANGSHPRKAYIAAALLAAVHFLVGLCFLEETVDLRARPKAGDDERSPVSSEQSQKPVWGFFRLFMSGARLRARAVLFSLHCVVEGKVLQDQASILQMALGWGAALRSSWTSGLGLAILIGGQCTGVLVRCLGEHRFAAVCHMTSFLAFLGFRRQHFWLTLALLSLGQQRRTVSSSWVVAEAGKAGYGRGEVVGWIASLRAAVEAISALLYSQVYRLATDRGRPSNVFLLPALVVALAECQRAQIFKDGVGLKPEDLVPDQEVAISLASQRGRKNSPLGLSLDLLGGRHLQICAIARGSVVDAHNAKADDEARRLKVGDFVVAVNGTESKASELVKLLEQGAADREQLRVTLRRPPERLVELNLGGSGVLPEGLQLKHLDGGMSLHVEAAGTARETGLRRHDRIVAVNSIRGHAPRLLIELRKGGRVELWVQRCLSVHH